MSDMRDLVIDIQDEIERGQLTLVEIAEKFNVSFQEVLSIEQNLSMFYEHLARLHVVQDVGCEFDPKI